MNTAIRGTPSQRCELRFVKLVGIPAHDRVAVRVPDDHADDHVEGPERRDQRVDAGLRDDQPVGEDEQVVGVVDLDVERLDRAGGFLVDEVEGEVVDTGGLTDARDLVAELRRA